MSPCVFHSSLILDPLQKRDRDGSDSKTLAVEYRKADVHHATNLIAFSFFKAPAPYLHQVFFEIGRNISLRVTLPFANGPIAYFRSLMGEDHVACRPDPPAPIADARRTYPGAATAGVARPARAFRSAAARWPSAAIRPAGWTCPGEGSSLFRPPPAVLQ